MMYVIIGLMWALWAVGQAIIWIIRVIIIIVHVIRFVINIIIIAITFLVNIIMVMIDIIFFIVDFILDFLAIFGIGGGAPKKQYGGPVMETGIYHLEAGEEVETVGEGQEQHEEAMMVREETLESINDLVHFLRYEREE